MPHEMSSGIHNRSPGNTVRREGNLDRKRQVWV